MNKCITAQITDFEQAVLVQANDKWRPITLADGVFDLDELKKDISAADDKFAGRKHKPTALILEYLTAMLLVPSANLLGTKVFFDHGLFFL